MTATQVSFSEIAREVEQAFEKLSMTVARAQVQHIEIDKACSELSARLTHCMAILRKYYIEHSGESGSLEDPAIRDVCNTAYRTAWRARRDLLLQVEHPLRDLMFQEFFPDNPYHITSASLRDVRGGVSYFVGLDVRDLTEILKGMDRLLQLQQGKVVKEDYMKQESAFRKQTWQFPLLFAFVAFVLVYLSYPNPTLEQLIALILATIVPGTSLSVVAVVSNYKLTVNVYGSRVRLDLRPLPPISELEELRRMEEHTARMGTSISSKHQTSSDQEKNEL